MNALQILKYNEKPIRTIDRDGDPWFVGKDVAEVLGYSNTRDALAKHVRDRDKDDVAICDAMGREQPTVVINEKSQISIERGEMEAVIA